VATRGRIQRAAQGEELPMMPPVAAAVTISSLSATFSSSTRPRRRRISPYASAFATAVPMGREMSSRMRTSSALNGRGVVRATESTPTNVERVRSGRTMVDTKEGRP
jgi:hypothetical protein